jgi:hypothetical protein
LVQVGVTSLSEVYGGSEPSDLLIVDAISLQITHRWVAPPNGHWRVGRTHTNLGAGFMESSIVFSHSYRLVDIPDYANTEPPVQVPVFSDRPNDQSMAGTETA